LALVLCAAAAFSAAGDSASRLAAEAAKAQKAGDTFHAFLLYVRAAELDPSNLELRKRRDALAAVAALSAASNTEPPNTEPPNTEPPNTEEHKTVQEQLAEGELSPAEISDSPEALPPPRLKPSPVRTKFDLRGNARDIATKVAAAFGVTVEVDGAYQPPPDFLFRTGEMNMDEAFRAFEAAANSLLIPFNDHSVLLARDLPQRRTDSLPMMTLAIPIPERLAAQDAQEIVTAVQQTLEIRRIQADPLKRTVYVRDSVPKVLAARQLFQNLSRLRGQIEVDVQLISIDKSTTTNLGVNFPNSAAIVNLGNFLSNTPSLSGFTQFMTFGGGKTLFGIGVASAEAFALVTRSDSRTVLLSQIVTLDGQAGSLHVGDRYPIITNGYYGNTTGTGTGTGTVYTPPPTVNFVDLGLVLKVTPSMHEDGEMTLDVDAQFNVLGPTGANNIPAINQNKYTGKVRLASDEWAVIAGLTEDDRSTAVNGVAGLARIPLIGHLFRQDTYNKDHSQVWIVLRPHVIDLPPWEFPTQKLWVGTESKPLPVY
jgi:general secretion pathway protein D